MISRIDSVVHPYDSLFDQNVNYTLDSCHVPFQLVADRFGRDDTVVVLGQLEHLGVIDSEALGQRLYHVAAVIHGYERERIAEQAQFLDRTFAVVQRDFVHESISHLADSLEHIIFDKIRLASFFSKALEFVVVVNYLEILDHLFVLACYCKSRQSERRARSRNHSHPF